MALTEYAIVLLLPRSPHTPFGRKALVPKAYLLQRRVWARERINSKKNLGGTHKNNPMLTLKKLAAYLLRYPSILPPPSLVIQQPKPKNPTNQNTTPILYSMPT